MLECAIHPITYRGEEILATVVKLVPKTTTKIHPYIPVLYINYIDDFKHIKFGIV